MPTAILLIVLTISYRIGMAWGGNWSSWIPNFSPLASIALCGAAFLPRFFAFTIPVVAMLASDWILNTFVFGVPFFSLQILPRYAAIALVAAIGWRLRPSMHQTKNAGPLLCGAVFGSLLFYLITNTAAWTQNPAYAQSAAGWLEAITYGEPGFAPSWMFFRNSLVSDLVFTGLFYCCVKFCDQRLAASPRVRIAQTSAIQ